MRTKKGFDHGLRCEQDASRRLYDVTWGTLDLGAVDAVKPDLKLKLAEKKVGSIGDIVVGHWIIGLEGTITVEAREVDLVQLQGLMPWYTSGSIPLTPATWHKDLYDYAAKLTIHPNDLPILTLTQDITLLKAVPMIRPAERDGVKPDVLNIEFSFYPDRAQLVTSGSLLTAFGYIGAAP